MFEKLRIIFSIPELRKKVLLTIGLLAVYRIGFHIPLPMVATNLADTGGTASVTAIPKTKPRKKAGDDGGMEPEPEPTS